MADIVLVTMPWDILESPSLGLGILHRLLGDRGFDVETLSLKLRWMELLLQQQAPTDDPITLADYDEVACQGAGVGDWIFAEAPMASAAQIEAYAALLRDRIDGAQRAKFLEMRRLAPVFLAACAEELLARDPRVVGFTTTFAQNMASLALARRLKQARPSLRVVFGGGNCEGPMGAALQRCFPWIDVVVRGEGEEVVPDLFRSLLAGVTPRPAPGLCFFADGRQVVVPNESGAPVAMDTVPTPDYDGYFSDLAACSFQATLQATMFLSFESARGCWWGEVAHCTFCGLNGASMAFRRKSPGRVLEEMRYLSGRHHVLDLHAVDNILDQSYFSSLIPEIARSGIDWTVFYEVKSNLKKRQLELLRQAGVRQIQPGIESLSTPILKLMRKGVTAWQNLRLLKWCAELGIQPEWNLIYGFPGEPEDEYRAMADLLPALAHLEPPNPIPLGVHRFSPYHREPERHGIEITGPAWYYHFLYDVDSRSLTDLAYEFEFRHCDGRSPEGYAAGCLAAIDRWAARHAEGASLVYRRGPGFIHVRDGRGGQGSRHFAEITLEGAEAEVYLACDDGARFPAIVERTGLSPAAVQSILDDLGKERLVFREGDHYLGLALSGTQGLTGLRSSINEETRDGAVPGDQLIPLRARARS